MIRQRLAVLLLTAGLGLLQGCTGYYCFGRNGNSSGGLGSGLFGCRNSAATSYDACDVGGCYSGLEGSCCGMGGCCNGLGGEGPLLAPPGGMEALPPVGVAPLPPAGIGGAPIAPSPVVPQPLETPPPPVLQAPSLAVPTPATPMFLRRPS